jgi:cell division protein FtsN
MESQSAPDQPANPWQEKGTRHRNIILGVLLVYILYVFQDAQSLFKRREKLCRSRANLALCREGSAVANALTSVSNPDVRSQGKGNFTVQLGSYGTRKEADTWLAQLQNVGVSDLRIVKANIPKKGTWYRIQVGRFTDRKSAQRYGQKLQSEGKAANYFEP